MWLKNIQCILLKLGKTRLVFLIGFDLINNFVFPQKLHQVKQHIISQLKLNNVEGNGKYSLLNIAHFNDRWWSVED